MKLSAHAFTRFWDLHAWLGVFGGLVFYVLFVAGSVTLFRGELEVWQEPLAQGTPPSGTHQAVIDRALGDLAAAPDRVWFYPRPVGAAQFGYTDPSSGVWQRAWIEGSSARLVPERERLSGFLYDLHCLRFEALGDWLHVGAGLLAVAFLLALATGVLIHLKDLARQFHQFRPNKSRRVLWSDMHKVLGVMGLPFQAMYAYTGALLALAPLLLGALVWPVFDGDVKRAQQVLEGAGPPALPDAGGAPANALSLDVLARRARQAEPRLVPESYRLYYPGREHGQVEVRGALRDTIPVAYASVRLDAVTGEVLHVSSRATETASGVTWRWIAALHYVYFGGLPLKFFFLFLALATCVTILTGNWIWLVRRESRAGVGHRCLSRLTAGVGAGTVVAVAALFLASRLLPLEWAQRTTVEELTFVVAWVLCTGWAMVSRDTSAIWWKQLGLAGVLLVPVPLLASRWSSAGVFGDGPHDPTVVAVDVALLIAAAGLCTGASWLRRSVGQRRVAALPVDSDEGESAEQVVGTECVGGPGA